MIEQFILGMIQGVAEWLPVSSEGLILLAKTNLFAGDEGFMLTIRQALFLHLGTFLAALLYFRLEVITLIKSLFSYRKQPAETQKLLTFLIISTLLSGVLGYLLLLGVGKMSDHFEQTGRSITLLIGLLLIITGSLELKAKRGGYKEISELTLLDGVLLGVAQGFAALPGLSRSGLTVSALLLRKFNKKASLKLSFLMSLPIVLGGNIALNSDLWQWPPETYTGLVASFVFGLLTIHLLLKLADKINFGIFVLIFAALTILSVFI